MVQELEEILNEAREEDESAINFAIYAIAFYSSIFVERIEQEIGILRTAGMSDAGIIRTLSADFDTGGRIFGEYSRSIKRGIILGIMQGFRVGQDAIYGDSVQCFLIVQAFLYYKLELSKMQAVRLSVPKCIYGFFLSLR